MLVVLVLWIAVNYKIKYWKTTIQLLFTSSSNSCYYHTGKLNCGFLYLHSYCFFFSMKISAYNSGPQNSIANIICEPYKTVARSVKSTVLLVRVCSSTTAMWHFENIEQFVKDIRMYVQSLVQCCPYISALQCQDKNRYKKLGKTEYAITDTGN